MSLLALLACGASPIETAPEADTCPAATLDLVTEWPRESLPDTHDTEGSQPGVGVADLDGDGWLDAVIAFAGGSVAYRNDGAGELVEEPAFTVDGGAWPWAQAVAFADVDGDGDPDAHLGRWDGELDLLLYNDGTGVFTSVPLPGSEGATFSGAFADADGDTDLDLVIGAGAMNMTYEAISSGELRGDPNLLYLQDAEGSFVLDDAALPEETRYGITFQASWIDADLDGDLDLYVANDAGPWLDPNHLLLNDGAGRFTDAPDCGCGLAMYAMGAAVGDTDDNGAPDLYITDVAGPNLLANQGDGTFFDATLARHADLPAVPTRMTSWGTVLTDLDADRDLDAIVTFGRSGQNFDKVLDGLVDGEDQPDVVLLGVGGGDFDDVLVLETEETTRSRAVGIGDLDRDGRPDLVIAGKHYLRAWMTGGGCDGRLTVTADAGGMNRDGIGAEVIVEVAGEERRQWMLPGATGSSSAPELYFGLGDSAVADRVTVRWPDGDEASMDDVAAGSTVAFVR